MSADINRYQLYSSLFSVFLLAAVQPTEFAVKRGKVMLSPLHPHLGVCELHNDASAKANFERNCNTSMILYDSMIYSDMQPLTCSNCCYGRLFETKDEEVRT